MGVFGVVYNGAVGLRYWILPDVRRLLHVSYVVINSANCLSRIDGGTFYNDRGNLAMTPRLLLRPMSLPSDQLRD